MSESDLDEARLREQLERGAPPDRVRAAWSLALRLGRQAAPELRDRLDREPSAGARRHLVVVLAGYGERDAVRAVVEHDPNALVRATAIGSFTRISKDAIARDAYLAERLAHDDAPEVALAVLEVMGAPTESLALAIERLLAHASLEVRTAAVVHYESPPLAPEAVIPRAIVEPDRELRMRLVWLALARDPGTLARLDDDTVEAVLRRAAGEGLRLSWSHLALVRCDATLVLDVLADALDTVPLRPLLHLLAESFAHGTREDVIDRVLDRCEEATLNEADRAVLLELAEPFRPLPSYDWDRDPLWVTRAAVRVARIDRLARS